jgi:signal transduction histidine kinase
MVVLALIGGAMMSRSMSRRIEVINETSLEIMSGDLSRRIPSRGTNDDFDKLAENLNTMLDRIEALMEGVKRVSDNIAHDLRTPLARLRNHLEMLKKRPLSDQNHWESVETAIAEADGLLSTFNALLRIAGIESKKQRTDFGLIDLEQLLQDVAELYEPIIEEKRQQFDLQVNSHVAISGDRDLLFQCIANLLDNAIKYTPKGGTVVLALETTDKATQIIIADSGPGIPEEERERVFQRFYRLEESRTTAGNGLGLSLASAVASLHDMTITLQDNYPGLRVVLETPLRLVESRALESNSAQPLLMNG